jgi:hypothetical protein
MAITAWNNNTGPWRDRLLEAVLCRIFSLEKADNPVTVLPLPAKSSKK